MTVQEEIVMIQRFLTIKELGELLGKRSRSAIYQDISAGRLPKPIKLGARILWPENDLAKFLADLKSGASH